ncbi:hypothetical protein Sjap_013780 [Stephania japonica]|uniref:Uncharacterized protein n=1 Tax=Stephania japonica TaxID=461633 RepID=A0AAP0NYX8_9MAGN
MPPFSNMSLGLRQSFITTPLVVRQHASRQAHACAFVFPSSARLFKEVVPVLSHLIPLYA